MSVCETASDTDGGLRLGRRDGLVTLTARLFAPHPLEIVFPFFADAGRISENLRAGAMGEVYRAENT